MGIPSILQRPHPDACSPEQRRLLREVGFTRCQVLAFAELQATPDVTQALAEGLADVLVGPMGAAAIEQGWVDQVTLDELVAGARSWGADPDALWASIQFATIGWAG